MFAKINDPIKTTPDIDGHAKAWRLDLAAAQKLCNIKPEDDGALDVWIVEAPWANLAWHSYGIVLVHLRPMPDNRETRFYLKDASHEIWVYALDPNQDRNEMLKTGALAFLTPKNFAAQFIEPNDDEARKRVETSVRMICAGNLSPDSDYLRAWTKLFGDNMIKAEYR